MRCCFSSPVWGSVLWVCVAPCCWLCCSSWSMSLSRPSYDACAQTRAACSCNRVQNQQASRDEWGGHLLQTEACYIKSNCDRWNITEVRRERIKCTINNIKTRWQASWLPDCVPAVSLPTVAPAPAVWPTAWLTPPFPALTDQSAQQKQPSHDPADPSDPFSWSRSPSPTWTHDEHKIWVQIQTLQQSEEKNTSHFTIIDNKTIKLLFIFTCTVILLLTDGFLLFSATITTFRWQTLRLILLGEFPAHVMGLVSLVSVRSLHLPELLLPEL